MILSIHVKGKQRIVFLCNEISIDDPWSTILRKYELTHSSNKNKRKCILDEISFSSHIFSSRFYLSASVCWVVESSMVLHCQRKRFLWPFVGEEKSFSHTHRVHWHCIPYRPLYIPSLAHLQSFEEHLDQSLCPGNSSGCRVLTLLCVILRKIVILLSCTK